MPEIILKSFLVLVLLSLSTSGQEKIMVCKDIQNAFTTGAVEGQNCNQRSQLQGPPGEKGVPGSRGPPGFPGGRGLPGSPGIVDYEKIFEMFEEKFRERPYCSVGAGHGGKIPDSSFTASSEYNSYHLARQGRLNALTHSWAPKTAEIGQWIQVDLGKNTTIRGVMIQGRHLKSDQWVTSFHVGCGLTTSSMRKISDRNGTVTLFIGNTDRDTVVTNIFRNDEECRYLRIYPQTWVGFSSLRMDFIGYC